MTHEWSRVITTLTASRADSPRQTFRQPDPDQCPRGESVCGRDHRCRQSLMKEKGRHVYTN